MTHKANNFPYMMFRADLGGYIEATTMIARGKSIWVRLKGYAWVLAVVEHGLREDSSRDNYDRVLGLVWEDIAAAFCGNGDLLTTALIIELFSALLPEQQIQMQRAVREAVDRSLVYCHSSNVQMRYSEAQMARPVITSWHDIRDVPKRIFHSLEPVTEAEVVAMVNQAVREKAAADAAHDAKAKVRQSLAAAPRLSDSFYRTLARNTIQLVKTGDGDGTES